MMSSLLLPALLSALIAGVVSSSIVPLVIRIAFFVQALDYPGERRSHGAPVPRLGGLTIAAGLVFGGGSVALMRWPALMGRVTKTELMAVLVATAMVFLVGLVDDITGVSVIGKLVVESAAAVLVVSIGWRFTVLGVGGGKELPLGLMGSALTVVWIVGVANAINLLDGLDGLASGVVALIAGSVLIYSVLQSNLLAAIVMGAVCGACLGFLPHNWHPATIFMGDSGALTLGFLLAVVSVHSSLKAPAAVAILVPILALGVPVVDTVLVMVVRFLERPEGRIVERLLRMFRADRNHIHHLMQRHGASRARVVRAVYLLVMGSCLMALTVHLTKSWSLGLALVVVEAAAILLVRALGLPQATRSQSERKREEVVATLSPAPVSKPPR
jgi:UDP-GlcNAc:undecaprenyl-phosphate GlcNAc-1-phosphate transferase